MEDIGKRQRIRSKKIIQLKWENALNNRQFDVSPAQPVSEDNASRSTERDENPYFPTTNAEDKSKELEWISLNQSSDDLDYSQEINADYESDSEQISISDSICFIAAVFVQNNVSKNLASDIFECFHILKEHPSIRIKDIRMKIDEWSKCETRVYSFCVCCNSILGKTRKCMNKECSRYSVSQCNVSSMKTVITYSIRQQMEELIRNGYFDDSILTRLDKNPVISGRLCDTKKYKDKLANCEADHPGMITLFLSMNTDGFRKRGCSRGEMWPVFLAAHDITKGEGTFREYNPQNVLLSAIMQTSGKLCHSDFHSLFERMNFELQETNNKPLDITLNGIRYDVRLELYQSILDMDASRKIRGLPVWQSHGCCSLCDVEGVKIRTRAGRSISWHSLIPSTSYDDDYLPTKLVNTCLPPPHHDGYHSLHIIFEGTSKDLLKDIMGNGKRTGTTISRRIRLEWANALSTANTPRGRSSAALLDPIQLSTRTGSEIQELYDIALPVLLVILSQYQPNDFIRMVYLHWLTTRNVNNCFINEKTCEIIDRISPVLRHLVRSQFPTIYTMKFHVFIDHMIPELRLQGSPHLSSAAPFERMNQTLGRSSNSHTTRAIVNISNRFLAFKRSVQYLSNKRKLQILDFPYTMKSYDQEKPLKKNSVINPDRLPLNDEEKMTMNRFSPDTKQFKFFLSYYDGHKTYSVRRLCKFKNVQNCFIHFEETENTTEFGCIERFFIYNSNTYAFIQKFSTKDPFKHILANINKKGSLTNQFFLNIVGSSYFIIDVKWLRGFITILEFSQNSYVSRC